MSRFYFPDKFFRVVNEGNLLAYFMVVDNELGLEFSNFRLIRTKDDRVFAAPPFNSYENADGKTVYVDHIRAAYDPERENNRNAKGEKYMKALNEAAYEFYQKKTEGKEPVGATTGRGPVETTVPEDDLPF